MFAKHPAIAKRWSKEYPNQGKLPEHVRKKKYKISVNNKLKGALGEMDTETNKIQINVKKHKGDKAELASTIKHELLHVKHPTMTEKEVYKKSAKTKIPPKEQHELLKKLSRARISKDTSTLRKKYKVESSEPGAIYQAANENPVRKVSIMGLV